ncbi:MAG TPA: biotin/lipoyl-binding protein [Bacteroidia bacterium]|nr:biotin/lipoyl-binding protein [Bacteroidia bacterium]
MIKNKNLEKVIEKINENKKTIIIVLVLLLIMGAYSLYGKYQDANPDFSYEIIELEKRDLKKIISIDGKIVSDYEINLASEIPGIISKIYVKGGDYVKKGQLLMKLKDTDLRNQVNSAYANKQLAEVSLQKIKNPNQNIDKDSEIAKYNTEIIKNDIAKLNSDLEFNLSTLDTYLDQLLRLSIDDYFDHVETNPSFTYRIKSEIKTSALEEERKKLGLD